MLCGAHTVCGVPLRQLRLSRAHCCVVIWWWGAGLSVCNRVWWLVPVAGCAVGFLNAEAAGVLCETTHGRLQLASVDILGFIMCQARNSVG